MYRKATAPLLVGIGALITVGCSSVGADQAGDSSDNTAYVAELDQANEKIRTLESQLQDNERALDAAQASSSLPATPAGADASLFPPNPRPGACYARVLIPARYQTSNERVLKREAAERVEIVPAEYEMVEETVLVKEASTRLEVIPAIYGDVEQRVMVSPASQKLINVPAEYRTEEETVLDKPAHTIWKRGPATGQTGNVLSERHADTGEIMCLVEVPATYRTVAKQVLISPARTDVVEIPAEYTTVKKRVLKSPATTREVTIPAEFKAMSVRKLVHPAQERRLPIPAEYDTVTKTAKVTDEYLEWRRVMCEVNLTHGNVLALQQALADKGYYKGPMDGIIGSLTLRAASAYAKDNGLPAGSNYIPVKTIESLGLSEQLGLRNEIAMVR